MAKAKRVPNPYGKRGGLKYQEKVNDVSNELQSKGYKVSREKMFETPGGFKNVRFADVAAYNGVGQLISIHQIGRATVHGISVMRETLTISDIWSTVPPGVRIFFHPYN